MMKLHSIANKICLGTSIACLGLAYLLAGYRWILFALPVMIGVWIILKKRPMFESVSSLLFIYILLAVIGVIADLSTLLIVSGSTAALACWDLTLFGSGVADNPPTKSNSQFEKNHLRSLAMAAFIGWMVALISSYVSLQIPFAVAAFLALTAVGCLTYGLQAQSKNNP